MEFNKEAGAVTEVVDYGPAETMPSRLHPCTSGYRKGWILGGRIQLVSSKDSGMEDKTPKELGGLHF